MNVKLVDYSFKDISFETGRGMPIAFQAFVSIL